MASSTVLSAKEGQIWKRRPEVTSSGLVSVVYNRKHRSNATSRPLFVDAAFSASGMHLVTVDARGHLVVFYLLKNRFRHVKHTGSPGVGVLCSASRKDEVLVALADGTVQCYNLETGKLLAKLSGHKRPVHSMSFNSTGTVLLTASVDTALLWSVHDWSRIRTLGSASGITQAEYIPHQDLIAAAFRDNSLLVWDGVSYNVKARLRLPEDHGSAIIQTFAAPGDGQYLLAGTRTGSLFLWELASEVLVRVIDLAPPAQVVSQARFLPDNRVAAVLADDGRVLFLSVAAGACRALLDVSVSDRPLLRFALDPTGRYMASVVSDGRLLIHDIEAARRHKLRVKEAHRRMGVSGTPLQPLVSSKSFHSFRDDGKVPVPFELASPVKQGLWADPPTGFEDATAIADGSALGSSSRHPGPAPTASGGALVEVGAVVGAGAGAGVGAGSGSGGASGDARPRRVAADTGGFSASANLPPPIPTEHVETKADDTTGTPGRGGATGARHETAASGAGAGPVEVEVDRPTAPIPDRVTSRLIDAVFPQPMAFTGASGAEVIGLRRDPLLPPSMMDAGRRTTGPPKRDSRHIAVEGLSVYKLASMDPTEMAVNDQRLRCLLRDHGRFPEKYRTLIWRFLLRLPENSRAYANLLQRGVHPAYSSLHVRYPLRDKRLLRRLRRTVSALAFWSPVFGELPYLPELAFPFVKQFGFDTMCAFECVMAVLLNWCGSWTEVFPYPPLPELGRVESLLRHHDPQLADHLSACGASAHSYAWTMLRSLFSEVLAKDEWLQLWDHLITHANQPELLSYATVAYLITFRSALMAVVPSVSSGKPRTHVDHESMRSMVRMSARLEGRSVPPSAPLLKSESCQEIEAFLRHQNAVDMRRLIRVMYQIRRSTPGRLVPTPGTSTWPGRTPGSHVFGPGGLASAPGAQASLEASNRAVAEATASGGTALRRPVSGPAYMLPDGEYPPFLRYPKFVVDFQMQERERIRAEEEGIAKRRALAAELAQRNEALAQEELAWKEERELLLSAEAARQEALREIDAVHAKERHSLSEEERSRRLEAISRLQETTRAALNAQRTRRNAAIGRMQDDSKRRRDELERLVEDRLEEERVLSMEAEAGSKVKALQLKRQEEEELLELQAALEARRKADELTDRLLTEKWSIEDQERRLRRETELEAHERLTAEAAKAAIRRELDAEQMAASLEQEAALAKVMRERTVRHLKEEKEARVSTVAAEARRFEEAMQEEEALMKRRLLAEQVALRQQTATSREAMLEEEKQRAELEAEGRRRRLRALQAEQAKRDFEQRVLEKHSSEMPAVLEEEKALKEAVLALDEERRQGRELELDMLLQEQRVRESTAYQRALRGETIDAVARERQTLQDTRRQLEARAQQAEAARIARQREEMELLRQRQVRAAPPPNPPPTTTYRGAPSASAPAPAAVTAVPVSPPSAPSSAYVAAPPSWAGPRPGSASLSAAAAAASAAATSTSSTAYTSGMSSPAGARHMRYEQASYRQPVGSSGPATTTATATTSSASRTVTAGTNTVVPGTTVHGTQTDYAARRTGGRTAVHRTGLEFGTAQLGEASSASRRVVSFSNQPTSAPMSSESSAVHTSRRQGRGMSGGELAPSSSVSAAGAAQRRTYGLSMSTTISRATTRRVTSTSVSGSDTGSTLSADVSGSGIISITDDSGVDPVGLSLGMGMVSMTSDISDSDDTV